MGGTNPISKTCEPKNENEFPASFSPQWIELPPEVTANILSRLGAIGILEGARNVCTTWRRVCQDPAMWRVLHFSGNVRRISAKCLRALDLSQGQLLDLSIRNFGDDDLLNYIVDRSSDLKRLTIQDCIDVSGKGLVEAVKKLTHLEELHLFIMPEVKAAKIKKIGMSCPILKSFTFNRHGVLDPSKTYTIFEEPNRNEYALAIANSMPNLCHLRLIANSIDNDGLEAILDGCLNLESLDLRQCFVLDLRGALGKRCSEQIKHLKFPFVPVSYIEYLGAPKGQDTDDRSCSESSDTEIFDDYMDYSDYECCSELDEY